MSWRKSNNIYIIYCGREHNEGSLFLLRGDFGERTRQNKKRVHAFLFCRVLSPKFSRSKNKDLELCNLCRNYVDCYIGAIWRVISITTKRKLQQITWIYFTVKIIVAVNFQRLFELKKPYPTSIIRWCFWCQWKCCSPQ